MVDQLAVVHETTPITRDTLADARETVRQHARRSGLSDELTGKFVAAFAEIANNTITHANTTGQLRILQEDATRIIAEISDRGPGLADSTHALPDVVQTSGRGLWLAQQCADRLSVTGTPGGTVVHVEMFLDHGAPGDRGA